MPKVSTIQPLLHLRPRLFSTTHAPHWTGRTPEEHVVNRTDRKDAQSQPSQQGMQEKKDGQSHSHAISEKGGEGNRQAEKERSKAPRPVIGMNDERGAKA